MIYNSLNSEKEDIAYHLAKYAHKGQMYGDRDYFRHHILGVVSNVELYCRYNQIYVGSEKYYILKISAYLHDTLEDSLKDYHIWINLIRKSFGEDVLEIVECLTRKDDETYFKYIHRVKDNEYARVVKVADIKFNLSECVLSGCLKAGGMVERYKKALGILEGEQK